MFVREMYIKECAGAEWSLLISVSQHFYVVDAVLSLLPSDFLSINTSVCASKVQYTSLFVIHLGGRHHITHKPL